MHFTLAVIAGLLSSGTPVLSAIVSPRAAKSTSTITITSTTVSTSAFTINTNIDATGVKTFIPGALTMTFKQVPAYVYIETSKVITKIVTSTSKVIVGAATSAPATTTTSAPSTGSTSTANAAYVQCFIQGSPATGGDLKVFSTYTTSDPETCLSYCNSTTACQSFSYAPATKACVNYSGAFADDSEITKGNTGVFFGSKNNYDGRMTCYENAIAGTSS